MAVRLLADKNAAPARSSDGACTVVFEGRLFNRAELEAIAGMRDSSAGDADVLRCAYEQLGEALVSRLKGIFALVVWDASSRRVLAVRDPLGVTPLFYASTPGSLLFSPSFERLLRERSVSRSPNRLSLAAHLLELWPSSGETLVEGVRRVPPGHWVSWSGRGHELSCYWDPSESAEQVPQDAEEVLGRFEELLARAVDRCLEWGAAGIFLSGGVDSGTVASLAAERSSTTAQSPWALSLVYPHPSLNEEAMQRRVATGLGLPQVLLAFEDAVGPDGLLVASLEAAASSSAPPLNLWRPAYDALLGDAVHRGCSVILTGEGGDEWLVPPLLYAADRLATFDLFGLYRVWQARRRAATFSAARTLRSVLWDWGARPLLRQTAGAALQAWSPSATRNRRLRSVRESFPAWLAPDPDLRREVIELVIDALPPPAPRSLHLQAQRRLAHHARLGLLMEEWFEDGRKHGARILEPLLDPDLLSFLYHVPPRVLIRGGHAKWLARATLERRLPELVPVWPKPVYADRFWLGLMARQAPNAWRRLGGVEGLADLGVVDPDRFASAVANVFSKGSFPAAVPVWSAWTTEIWLREGLSHMISA